MPIFEYECTQCGKRLEHLQLNSDSPLAACPECAGELKRLMSAPAFQFKGSGWYVTDYAGKGKVEEKSNGGGSGEASTASSKAADSKESGSSPGDTKTTSTKTSSAKTSSPSD
jgi:putative FmdB family regulatory protein